MLIENAKSLLKELYENPRLAMKLSLGTGCERVAYRLNDEYAVKISKSAMYNRIALQKVLEVDAIEDTELYLYSRHLRDYSPEDQTEKELELFRALTDAERKIFNPIIDVGEFNDALFTISPLVTTGKKHNCYEISDLCDKLEKDFDYDSLDSVCDRFTLDKYDLTSNSGNFGTNCKGDIVIIDYGLEEF